MSTNSIKMDIHSKIKTNEIYAKERKKKFVVTFC